MANWRTDLSLRYPSGIKRNRQNKKRHMKNQMERRRIRTSIKKTLEAIKAGNKESTLKVFSETVSIFDRGVKHGVVNKKTASRKKSRLAKKIAQLG